MRVGVPTEIKPDEYRVALTPAGVRELSDAGHEVFVQRGAGDGSGVADDAYAAQGAIILKQGSNVRLIQPSAFEASYTYADGRPLSISEVAVQSPAAS